MFMIYFTSMGKLLLWCCQLWRQASVPTSVGGHIINGPLIKNGHTLYWQPRPFMWKLHLKLDQSCRMDPILFLRHCTLPSGHSGAHSKEIVGTLVWCRYLRNNSSEPLVFLTEILQHAKKPVGKYRNWWWLYHVIALWAGGNYVFYDFYLFTFCLISIGWPNRNYCFSSALLWLLSVFAVKPTLDERMTLNSNDHGSER